MLTTLYQFSLFAGDIYFLTIWKILFTEYSIRDSDKRLALEDIVRVPCSENLDWLFRRIFLLFAGRDPHHLELYKTTTQYLSFLNAETLLPNPNLTSYRNNFIKLRKVVLIGGPDDGVITPWQSSHFAVFDEKEVVVPLRDQDAYKSDLTGLRTLDERGDLVLLTKANVSHTTWHIDKDVFKDCIEPFLT